MFTGIIQHIGQIQSVTPIQGQDSGVAVWVATPTWDLADVQIGDSIAIQGACMTVVQLQNRAFAVHVSQESLQKTVGLDQVHQRVNLEAAMRLGDTFDGHMVSGHVDGVGRVTALQAKQESHELCIHIPREMAIYMAYKGSVTVNGVSLTVNAIHDHDDGCEISINLIPHTFAVTTLQDLSVGDGVNIEVDTIARYVARYVARCTSVHASA